MKKQMTATPLKIKAAFNHWLKVCLLSGLLAPLQVLSTPLSLSPIQDPTFTCPHPNAETYWIALEVYNQNVFARIWKSESPEASQGQEVFVSRIVHRPQSTENYELQITEWDMERQRSTYEFKLTSSNHSTYLEASVKGIEGRNCYKL